MPDDSSAGWRTVRLGDICSVDWGNTTLTKNLYSSEGFPAYSATGQDGLLPFFENEGSAIIVSAIGARCGKCFFASGKWTAIKNTIIVKSKEPGVAVEEFLFFLLDDENKWPRSGSGQPFIGIGNAENIRIQLPPFREQQAIAYVLKTVLQSKEARQRELVLERERKAMLMEHLFSFGVDRKKKAAEQTSYGLVPGDWAVRLLDDCAFIQTGVAKGRKFKTGDAISVPYLRVANVQNGYLNLAEMKQIEIRKSELRRYQLAKGDVVLTEGGDFDKLGRGFVWKGELPLCVHQNHVFAVRPNQDIILSDYLAYLAQSPYGRSYFLSVAHKTTNLACINKTKLGKFPAIVPSLDVQKTIATILKACDTKIAAEEREVVCLQELFDAMLSELLAGKCDLTPLITEEVEV
jgi:type I restriction enzyme S subunit